MATVVLHQGEINTLLRGRGGQVVQHILTIGRRAEAIAKATAPRNTGALAASITHRVEVSAASVAVDVYSPLKYAIYQELGTGIYAGRGMIKPKSGRFLVFTPKGSATVVFARQVRGTPAKHFLEKALEAASPYPVTGNPLA